MKRATTVRRVQRAGAGALAATAIAGLFLYVSRDQPSKRSTPARHSAPIIAENQGRRCEHWSSVTVDETEDGWRIDDRIVAIAKDGGEVSLSQREPCETAFLLKEGTLVVDAIDLGGGTLTVRSGFNTVRVVGTLFAVDAEEDEVTVRVVEGKVTLSDGEQEKHVTAGESLTSGQAGWSKRPLSDSDTTEILDAARGEETPATAGNKRHRHRARRKSRKTKLEPEESAPKESADTLVRKARTAKAEGDFDRARALYRTAGSLEGATAEAAWIALARLEMELKRPDAALSAVQEHQARFGGGPLEVEAAYLEVSALQSLGRTGRAKEATTRLLERWPDTPQADALRRSADQK